MKVHCSQISSMSVQELFSLKKCVNVCAPMVRYSRLEFRKLVRSYDCDLCYTPMIIADSFIKSEKARNNDFQTHPQDSPLIVQFAATNEIEFGDAAELVAPHSNGVDLNCGCPQRWALKMGYGAHLLSQPELTQSIIRHVRNRINKPFTVSAKIRILDDDKDSVELSRRLEHAGVDFLTVHGRTKTQKNEPINRNTISLICDALNVPVIANGDVRSIEDAVQLQTSTGCKGVMSARGILQNPALFRGFAVTPTQCVKTWVEIALEANLYFMTFHHHLVFMLEKVLTKRQRRTFNNLKSYPLVLDFLNELFGFNFEYSPNVLKKHCLWEETATKGKYFLEKTETSVDLDDFFFNL